MSPASNEDPSVRARFPRVLWAACAVYLLLRARILYANFDGVSLPNYELALMGNLARLWTAGDGSSGIPLWRYYDNCGGHLVTGLLAIPGYALFGASYLALKLVPLTLGLGALLLLWRILDRTFDRRAAVVAVFLFALAPPTLVKYSMLAKGNHFENLFFQLAAWALFLRAHAGERDARRLVVFGAAAGFAIFFYFGSMLLVALLAALHVALRGVKPAARDLAPIGAGMLLGLAPLLWINWESGGRALSFLSAKVGSNGAADAQADAGLLTRGFERVASFWTDILPRAGVFEDLGPLRGRWAEALWLSCFAIAWIAMAIELSAAWRARRVDPSRIGVLHAAPLVLYLPLFTLVLAFSNFDFDIYPPPLEVGRFRYLVPHFLFAGMLIGLASARLIAKGGVRRALGIALAGGALSTALCTLPIAAGSAASSNPGPAYPGYDFDFYANLLVREPAWDPAAQTFRLRHDAIAPELAALRGPAHSATAFGIGFRAADVELRPLWKKDARTPRVVSLASLASEYPIEAHIDLARGVGSTLRRRGERNEASRAELRRRLAEDLDPRDPLAPYVIEGLALEYGLRMMRFTRSDLQTSREIAALVPRPWQGAFARGRGLHAGRLCARGLEHDVNLVRIEVAALAPQFRRDFWFGFGFGLADRTEDPRTMLGVATASDLPLDLRAALFCGVGAGLRHVRGTAAAERRANAARAELSDGDGTALFRGLAWPGYPAPMEL